MPARHVDEREIAELERALGAAVLYEFPDRVEGVLQQRLESLDEVAAYELGLLVGWEGTSETEACRGARGRSPARSRGGPEYRSPLAEPGGVEPDSLRHGRPRRGGAHVAAGVEHPAQRRCTYGSVV